VIIRENIKKEFSKAEIKIDEVYQYLNNTTKPTFSELHDNFDYPLFIYRDNSLFYWSDNKLPVSIEVLKGDYNYHFVNLKSGKFLVSKKDLLVRDHSYEIYCLIPLYHKYPIENNFIHSGINPSIFPYANISISTDEESPYAIYSPDGDFQFSVELFSNNNVANKNAIFCFIVFCIIFILCFFIYISKWTSYLNQIGKTDYAILLTALSLFSIRGVMLLLHFPYAFVEPDIFNSKYFASSNWSPSLGDLLLNTVAIFLFSLYLINNYKKSKIIYFVARGTVFQKNAIAFIGIVVFHTALYYVYYILKIIYFNSQWSFDITDNIDFNVFRVISIVIFTLISINFFVLTHISARIFSAIYIKSSIGGFWMFLAGTFVFIIILAFYIKDDVPIVFLSIAYFGLIIRLDFTKYLSTIKYTTYIYLLTASAFSAMAGAYAIYKSNIEKTLINKTKFASQLLLENDVLGEFLLNDVREKVENDPFIRNKLTGVFSSKDFIEQKIRKIYLSNYFDKYDISITIFDAEGMPIEANSEFVNYRQAIRELKKTTYRTEYRNLFFLNDLNKRGLRRYAVFSEVKRNNEVEGSILVLLKNKRIIPNNVYPSLLVDQKFYSTLQGRTFSYAIYNGNELLSSSGSVNYEKDFPKVMFEDPTIYDRGVIYRNIHHLAIKGSIGRRIIVSSEAYEIKDVFSNFSFLLTIFILFILIFLTVIASYFRWSNIRSNYSTKIQIYLNIAFFLPLFIVTITTLSIIGTSYHDNLNISFIKKAESVSTNISAYVENSWKSHSSKEKLSNTLQQIARYTEADINLFNNSGKLIYTSQPAIYENGLLSRFINPEAYAKILEQKNQTVMLAESVGKLKYNAVYAAVKSFETGRVIGIVSLPFFESKQEIDRQIIDVLTTILNIFISIFIFFLVLSYFATRLLIVPLKMITSRLKKTSLSGENEPIKWEANDEIGLVVNEYNRMLIKLDESRIALSKSEKESAWREMAQQVAHEIKNPLTPMKLTIQHLQMGFRDGVEGIEARIEKSLNALLNHINNLSDIATSFSLFAKMPVPKNEVFEVTSVLQNAIGLYNNNKDIVIETHIAVGKFHIMGDAQMMSGIFTNIIINGIQSIPSDRIPRIIVSLEVHGTSLIVSIGDNGGGIPDAIKDKVFLPNFSTKYAGSGIGLAVAKRGVEHAKGKIWFETFANIGTTFYIQLPLFSSE
ncbi:MAG TPA: HAMP domain-containing sensor histidine kinase, partial [Cytophagaceae bacterium]